MILQFRARHLVATTVGILVLTAGIGGLEDARAVLRINEFMAINRTTIQDETGRFSDWVEIYNDAGVVANLGGLYLTDNYTTPTKWMFPHGTQIAPGGFLLIWINDSDAIGSTYPLHATFRLNGEYGEQIGLYDRDGLTLLDTLQFGQQARDFSYGRKWDGYWDWGPLDPSPGESNSGKFTPPPARLLHVVAINEWMARNQSGYEDEFGNHPDWFELYNAGSIPLQLGGYYLTDDPAEPFKWPIPWHNVIAPSGFAVFLADNDTTEGLTHVNFKLSGSGESIGMYQKEGVTPVLIDSVAFGQQYGDISQGRWPWDGGKDFVFYSHATPRERNRNVSTHARAWHLYR